MSLDDLFGFLEGSETGESPSHMAVERLSPAPHSDRPKSSKSVNALLDDPSGVMFLDIETTGLSRFYDYVTLVGYQMGGEHHVLLAGESPERFRAALSTANSVVTFNGSTFDLPFLEHTFGRLPWPKHHVDLRYACQRLGLTGGQKLIEKELRITCRDGLDGVDGAMAVILWHRYLRGDVAALRELIEYNRADVLAMTFILDHVVSTNHSTDLLTRTSELYRFCERRVVSYGLAHPQADLPAAPSSLRPKVSFDSLFAGTRAEAATIVGLDLTGSSARPSGFCVLKGSFAETRVLGDDDAIIEATLNARPNLVSIDSPLCLPVGRTKVTDDDPYRHLGIMRENERILKRRGINVYPCLLPSMQRLTERGIRLAETLRLKGLHVIECYPGAAQDIMGIPRKGAGQEWLKLGLSEFGVSGDFTEKHLTHDELDAITCSLVGSFHLAGLTEGIAGAGEEPMIIPDLGSREQRVVGISGEMFAGKTTAARILESEGFAYTRISLVIEDVLRERGLEVNRENLQDVGLELHQTQGQRWLCRRAIERISSPQNNIVVDGLRWSDDVNYLAERFGGRFQHVYISAPVHLRETRARALGRIAEFRPAASHAVESGVTGLKPLASITIMNDRGLQTFERAVRERVFAERGQMDAG